MLSYKFVKRPGGGALKQIISLYREQGWWLKGDSPALAAAIVRGSHCFLVALEKGRLVGMGRAISDGAGDAYVQDVVVARDSRSRGVGSALVRRIKRRLLADGIKWIGLIAQDGSRRFYERLGFKMVRRAHPMILNDNHV